MNVLVVTYWSYRDALIQTYTLPYVRLIRNRLGENGKIYLLTIENPFHRMEDQTWNEECAKMERENIVLIRFKYDHFGWKMAFRFFGIIRQLIRLIKKEKIAFIHSWCMTAGALGYILSVFTKKPLIIDSYEPHADAMVENGTWKRSGIKYKILSWLEKKQSRRAKTVIALTEGMKDYAFRKYGATFEHYYVKPAMVNLEKFEWNEAAYHELRKKHQVEDRIVCLYAGKLGGIYLEEEVFDFFETAYEHWKDRLKIYLLTDKKSEEVCRMMAKRNIPETIIETRFVNYKDIPPYFTMADFAINPVKPVPSKRYCTSIKDGEYWAAGLPVVITPDISDDSDIIASEDIGYVLQELTREEYRTACTKMDQLLQSDKHILRSKIRGVAEQYRSFGIAEEIYRKIYE